MRGPSVEIVPLPKVLRGCFGRFTTYGFYPKNGREFSAVVEELDLREPEDRKLLLSALNGTREFRRCWSGRE